MAANVAMTSLQWTQPPIPHSSSSPQTLASPRKRSGNDVVSSLYAHRSPIFSVGAGAGSPSKLSRARSCEIPKPRFRSIVRSASSASFDSFSDEEFSKKIQELAMKFQVPDDDTNTDEQNEQSESKPLSPFNSFQIEDHNRSMSNIEPVESRWGEIYREPPDFPAMDQEIVIEKKANSLDLPFSLRIIRKKQSESSEGGTGIRESAYSSIKKAFSSMVFIIRELHSYTLQMREFLFYEDLQEIIARVHQELHASFVWLFQQVFSHTPTLMVYVMILLANFTVHSLASNASVTASPETLTGTVEVITSTIESPNTSNRKFDSSSLKSFSVSGKTASIGGNHGGGGKTKAIASGADGDGQINRSGHLHPGSANTFSPLTTREEESVQGEIGEEAKLWNAIVEEASRMQGELRDESLDSDTIRKLVSPVTAKIESDEEYPEFFRTELLYRMGLAQEPENPLLLANFAQFLYTVAHDNDRAEEYFKAAISIEPKDAEACNKYASFLWHVKKDLWAAEETYLEAISAEPSNTYYAANYAHFLWSTGGEDTCYPLDAEGAIDA